MTRISLAVAVLFLSVGACRSQPTAKSQRKQAENEATTIRAQQTRIDELTIEKVRLQQRVGELEAKLEKVEATEKVVEEVKEEISASVRRVLERFRGDKDVEVERTPGGYRFVLREKVLFETGSATLTDAGKSALDRVAAALRGGDSLVSVEGHTDDVPVKKPETLEKFPRGNIELSVERALSVWEYLVQEAKLDSDRMSVCGHGPNRPRVPNDSEPNRWFNRRVEILVQED